MTEFPIIVASEQISVGGLVDTVNLETDVGPAGRRGAIIFSGSGEPTSEPSVDPAYGTISAFQPGDLYIRQDEPYQGHVYIYKELSEGSEWVEILSLYEEVIEAGAGSPEGSVEGSVGELYTDNQNGHLYIKTTASGTTGWVQLESATSGSGDVIGPGSSTDNALVRFDGTGGKTVQNSAITVDDAGALTLSGDPTGALHAATKGYVDTADGLKADLDSPALTGTPTAPTAAGGTNTTQIATTAFVRGEVTSLVDSSPSTLDTLNELADALGDDPNFATTMTNALAGKLDLTGGTLTGNLNLNNANPLLSVKSSSANTELRISGPAGTSRFLRLRTVDANRWLIGASTAAESGSNAGSNFEMWRYADDGTTVLGYPLNINRATGLTTLESLSVTGTTTLSGNLTVAKTTADVRFASTSASNARLIIDRPAGWNGSILLRTDIDARWGMVVNSSAESGSNAGSDFLIQSYDDAGSLLSTPLTITRSTGDVTLGSNLVFGSGGPTIATGNGDPNGAVTANKGSLYLRNDGEYGTCLYVKGYNSSDSNWYPPVVATGTLSAGSVPFMASQHRLNDSSNFTFSVDTLTVPKVELGSSGPRMMSGTGSPQGVVTAPVGSIWFQTDSTVGVSHWRKASGTGDTGWVVMEGDTGWRNIAAWDASGVFDVNGLYTTFGTNVAHNGTGYLRMRRHNDQITYLLVGIKTTGVTSGGPMFDTTALPAGWKADNYWTFPLAYAGSGYFHFGFAGSLTYPSVYSNGATTPSRWIYTVKTTQAWPTSLPGSAA